jgi:hypothetical protein
MVLFGYWLATCRLVGLSLTLMHMHDSHGLRFDKNPVVFIRHHLKAIVIVLVVLMAGAFAFLYLDARNQLVRLSDPSGQLEGDALVKEIGKSIELPKESPTLATVSNASRLQSQEFFKEAKDGDKVLIFPKAGRALLYRPATHKVIEYSKVNLNAEGQQSP